MPSATRYVLTATARSSPSARLYSAVPRSSQCPSTVTTHVGYFFMMSALADTIARPASSRSELSSPKNAGLNGESRFRSSSERLPIASSLIAGTGIDSSTRSAGRGGGAGGPGVDVAAAGGGAVDATGAGFFFAQAPTNARTRIRTIVARRMPIKPGFQLDHDGGELLPSRVT